MRRTPRLLIAIVFLTALTLGIIFTIKYAKGYRPSLKNRALEGTGLLAANSFPKGATVFINDRLTTATDDTLNLPPGEYQVKIAKDGYIPWEKTLKLEPELVTQTNTRLFPSVPNLKPLTFSGATNPIPSPDGEKIVFSVTDATTDTKNGLYVLDLLDRPFSLNSDPRQISRTSTKYDLAQAKLIWSPDSSQILATLNSGEINEINFLLYPNSFTDIADFKDVTARLPVILKEWQDLQVKKFHEQLKTLPGPVQLIATASAKMVTFSPDEKKILFVATASAQLAENLIPSLPATSTQPETRQLEPGNYYIYDLEEDKNFLISLFSQDAPVIWYPDSNHVIMVEEKKIIIAEYDSTNHHTVYAGPFANNFIFPWPNGSSLIILTSLNGGSQLPPNLYSINLK
ncbi:MAG: PEGA domain-containing protein [Patescibacteria group bacterium]|nr:PEGA domain-containing protein [Patescibacteria group bacterium]